MPPVPLADSDTHRREITAVLYNCAQPLSAKEISSLVGIGEKEVRFHLEHIRKSLRGTSRRLDTVGPRCMECGFVFRKRDRLSRPGKCPRCRSERIEEPLFVLAKA